MLGSDAVCLGRVAADHGHQPAVRAIGELRDDHAEPVHAEPDDRVAERTFRRGAGDAAREDRARCGGEQEVAAAQFHADHSLTAEN